MYWNAKDAVLVAKGSTAESVLKIEPSDSGAPEAGPSCASRIPAESKRKPDEHINFMTLLLGNSSDRTIRKA